MRAVITLGFLLAAAPALAAGTTIHDFAELALSPSGDRTATVESDDPGNLPDEPHGKLTLRGADGRVLAQADPCAACKYSDTAWSPDSRTLVFLATDQKAGKTMLYAMGAGGGAGGVAVRVLATISGFANSLRWSPDGERSPCWPPSARTR